MKPEALAGEALLRRQKEELLALLLEEEGLAAPWAPTLTRRERGDDLPLSFTQQRLWFLDALEPGSSSYHIVKAVHLEGALDLAALQQALDAIVARHEVLRTTFAATDGIPRQVIADHRAVELPVIDLRGLPATARPAEVQRCLAEEARRPFDLSQDLMLRAMVVRLDDEEYALLLATHHIASDGWSMGILFRELSVLYDAFAAGEAARLPELPIQYADFALWQRERLQGEVLDAHLAFWRAQLAGIPAALDIPTDHPRPSVQTFCGARQFAELSPSLIDSLQAVSRREGATLFMTLLAAFQTLLSRYSGQEDVVVGAPIANRGHTELEGLIGFFANTLALRADLAGDPSFRELLGRVREMTLGAYAHQDLPFEKLVAELQCERDMSRSPVFQVAFVLQNAPASPLELAGFTVTRLEVENPTAKFDLLLSATEREQGLLISLEYNTDLFEEATITRMLGHYQTLLAGIAAAPDTRLSALPLLTEAERRQFLVTWNDTERAYPQDRCLHHLFEEQATRTPDAVAVSDEARQLTYRELNQRANRLAHALRRHGVGPDVRVGIRIERTTELVVGLLGILKAGGAYLPIDPADPPQRVACMLADAGVAVLLTQAHLRQRLPPVATVIGLDEPGAAWERESAENPAGGARAEDLAYVIYTSGSTGIPKGVAVPHRAVLRLVCGTDYVSITPADRVAQAANAAFDAATFEIWGALLHGACLVGLRREILLSPERLAVALRQQRISTLFLTTALFNQVARLAPDAFRSVRHLLFGGEAADPRCAAAVLRHGPPERLLHVYGPTETTTFATWYRVESVPADATTLPIGRPIANTQLYVLDRSLQPVPMGVPGELYIGGPGLARGYLDRPELTAERFLIHPVLGIRLYRTGDQVRYRPDGNLEFLGRLDDQVKVRGFRVELGEIETVLAGHPAVQAVAVTPRKSAAGEQRLVACVVVMGDARGATSDGRPTTNDPTELEQRWDAVGPSALVVGRSSLVEELRHFARERLPEYAVPSAFVLMDALPMTASGKIDRRALPESAELPPDRSAAAAAPRDAVELRLAEIWAELLELPSVGLTEDFFELGGHSLMAVRLRAQIEAAFDRPLPLVTLFQARTIAQQADALRRESDPVADGPLVPFHPAGSRTPFFCVYPTLDDVPGFCALARWLDLDQPFYGLQIPDAEGKPPETMRIPEMATRFITEMRRLQPQGPYLLGGYCFGGLVAFEMARQLQADGQSVDLLCLVDPSDPPGARSPTPHPAERLARSRSGAGRITGRILAMTRGRAQALQAWRSRHARMLGGFTHRERGAYVVAKLRYRLAWHGAQVIYLPYRSCRSLLPQAIRLALWDRLWRHTLFNAFRDARRNYVMQCFPGRLTLLRAAQHPAATGHDEACSRWQRYCADGVEFHAIPGDHLSIFAEPHVQVLAATLMESLRRSHVEGDRQGKRKEQSLERDD